MITKEKFVSYFDRLKHFWEIEEKVNDAFKGMDFMSFSWCQFEDLTVEILMDAMNDKDEFIPWWIYDRECGANEAVVTISDKDNAEKEVVLNTPEALYDFLVSEYGE